MAYKRGDRVILTFGDRPGTVTAVSKRTGSLTVRLDSDYTVNVMPYDVKPNPDYCAMPERRNAPR